MCLHARTPNAAESRELSRWLKRPHTPRTPSSSINRAMRLRLTPRPSSASYARILGAP